MRWMVSTTAVIRDARRRAEPGSFHRGLGDHRPVAPTTLTKATTRCIGAAAHSRHGLSAGLGQEAGVGATISRYKPLHPLLPSTCLGNGMFLGGELHTGTGYLVFLMNGITDASGNPAVPDTTTPTSSARCRAARDHDPSCTHLAC